MLIVGFSTAAGFYWATDPNPVLPMDYVARLPIVLLVLVGGSLFKLSVERATAERVREAYASLAGSIAREMRNPLGQLKYTLENIQNALPSPTTKAQAQVITQENQDVLYRHLAQGELAVQRGLQVISMTLDEVHQKPLPSDSFALLNAGEGCKKAVEEYGYEDDSQRSRVSLHVERDFVFRGDETAFLFVLFNLIKNALAYPQLQLRITVDAGEVQVSDNGPGIPPAVLARLFQPFHTSGKKGGTGLGLSYCQRVMQALGGRIRCSSVLGESTCFTLSFPPVGKAESEAFLDAALVQARESLKGRRLLVVDDQAALRAATCHKLAPTGALVDECADGLEALAMLARNRYDLVVLDLNMPGLDGYEVVERIRAGEPGIDRNLRIVAHSSEPAALTQVKTRKAGMNGFVPKPCDQVVLLQTLGRALQTPGAGGADETSQLAGRVVLLADDNAYIRKAVGSYLRHAGITVAEAESGQETLDLLGSMDRCDAILLDIEMPGMNGLDAARAIRASMVACRHAPILALTAHSGPDMVAAALDAGMSDLLVKPVEMGALYGKLLTLLEPAAVPLGEASKPESAPAPSASRLLDVSRLESFRRIGLLSEMLSDYLPAIERLLGGVEAAESASDLPACRDALHSLVGMSGEAGAQALHQLARSCYMPLVELGRWPTQSDWPRALRAVAMETQGALADYVATAKQGT